MGAHARQSNSRQCHTSSIPHDFFFSISKEEPRSLLPEKTGPIPTLAFSCRTSRCSTPFIVPPCGRRSQETQDEKNPTATLWCQLFTADVLRFCWACIDVQNRIFFFHDQVYECAPEMGRKVARFPTLGHRSHLQEAQNGHELAILSSLPSLRPQDVFVEHALSPPYTSRWVPCSLLNYRERAVPNTKRRCYQLLVYSYALHEIKTHREIHRDDGINHVYMPTREFPGMTPPDKHR